MDDLSLLHKIFVRLADDNEGTRNAAASAVYEFVNKHKVHASDLTVSLGGSSAYKDFESAQDIMLAEIKRLGNQLAYARQHIADPNVLKKLSFIGGAHKWADVETLLVSRFSEDGKTLPKHWKARLCSLSGYSSYIIARWQEGVLSVPDDVIVKLTMLSPAREPEPVKRAARSVAAKQSKSEPSPLQIQILQIVRRDGPQTVKSLSDILLGHTDSDGTIYQRLKTCWARKIPLVVLISHNPDTFDLSPAGQAALDGMTKQNCG